MENPIREQLDRYLACPHDLSPVRGSIGHLTCPECGRQYPTERGVIHFVSSDADRPRNPACLAQDYARNSPERMQVHYYRRAFSQKQSEYERNPAVRRAVDVCLEARSLVVDIATGHGGGFVPWLAPRISANVLLVGTDACVPVITGWYTCVSDIREAFSFIDVDLLGNLCFGNESVDVFTGIAVANVSPEPDELLREFQRCLRPGGYAVLQEMFFADGSQTASMLRDEGSMYASVADFETILKPIGLELVDAFETDVRRGKVDPRDGMPIDDNDEWADTVLHIRKIVS